MNELILKYVIIIIGFSADVSFAQQRPKIVEHPSDALATRDEPLTLNCGATGRPQPSIQWYHNGTPLVPSERRVVLPEGSLFFLRVLQNKREQDIGEYFCEAKSTAGVAVSRNATLQIAVLRDDFRLVPKDKVALVGGPVVLNCTPPRGTPEASVLWYMNGKLLDLSGKRLSTIDMGSLLISEVQPTDAGSYQCKAQNQAGIKTSPPAILKVLAPPTVLRGPQDTEVEVIEGDGLDLPCELTGDPMPVIQWYRENGEELPEGRSRILLDNTLRIENTRIEDQGKYICKGHNEGGNVTVAVKILVYASPLFIEAPSDVEVNEGDKVKLPCRAHGRPQPRIIWDRIGNTATQQLHNQQHQISSKINQYLERDTQEEALAKTKIMSLRSKRSYRMKRHKSIATGNQNKLHRTFNHEWHDNNQEITKDKSRRKKRESADNNERNGNVYDEDRSPTGAIPVLAFSTQAPQEVSQLKVTNGELILLNVTERDQGWYGCAAINEAGSVVKRIFIRVINGRDGNNNVPISLDGISSSDRFSNDQNILINTVLATSPNSLDISWDNNGIPSATALKLHYRIVGSNEFQTATAIIDAKEYTINDLQAYREYEVFASVPHGLSGLISNIRKGKTLDGPPSSAPTDIRVGIINITAAYVRWSPPPQNMLNGELIGYKIQIKSNVTNKLLGQMSLNATTQSVVINSLNPGGRYTARVAAQTAGGMGPYSTPAALHMDPSFISRPPKTDPAVAMWATTWMSGIALAILVITLISATIFALYWARKNKRNMKASYGPGILTANTLVDKQQTLWMHGNTLVKPIHSVAIQDANLSSEYAEVTQIMPKKNLPSVPPEPYATVTLQRGTQSDDSCIKCSTSPSSSEYNSPMIRESCDVLPLPPQPPSPLDHPYHPPNMSNMTIRTNPVAMSPICRRTATQSHWPTLPPPVPHLIWQQPQQQPSQLQPQHQSINDQQIIYKCNRKRSPEIEVEENDYESGSVLYEECDQNLATNFFNYGGEPTEEYYRNININMEFLNENELEQSNPCLDTMLKNRHKPRNDQSPVNSRRSGRKQSADSNQNSNDDDSTSESDNNRWPSRLRRSRSKSSDRKYRNGRTRRE